MAKKKKNLNFYSTNPDFEWEDEDDLEGVETLAPNQQKLYVMRDRKQRKGKEVTIVTGFVGIEEDLKNLGKKLKSKCGVGGTVKDGEIIIQGNQIQKILELLRNMGYAKTKQKGG